MFFFLLKWLLPDILLKIFCLYFPCSGGGLEGEGVSVSALV